MCYRRVGSDSAFLLSPVFFRGLSSGPRLVLMGMVVGAVALITVVHLGKGKILVYQIQEIAADFVTSATVAFQLNSNDVGECLRIAQKHCFL